jgi:hypothetical protein
MTTGDSNIYKSAVTQTGCLQLLPVKLSKPQTTINNPCLFFSTRRQHSSPAKSPRLSVEIRRLEVKPLARFHCIVGP